MYFYYFFCSEAWRKKARWRAIWRDVKPYILVFLSISLLLHIYVLPKVSLLLMVIPMIYYIFLAVRPSIYYTWDVDGKQFFCAVYYDRIHYLGRNGVMISGCGKEIFRKAKVRRCKNLDQCKILLVKIADSGRYMLYNAEYVNGLYLGKTLRNVGLIQEDSCFINGSTICFVMNSGAIFFIPRVSQYKVMRYLPKCDQSKLSYIDFFTRDEPKPMWQLNEKGQAVLDFDSDFLYVCYLAVQQKNGTETLLQVELSCFFIRQVLLIEGVTPRVEFFSHSV